VCGCMRDSTRDKPCPKWMAAFRERFNKALPRRATLLDWGKNERSLLEVLKDRPRSVRKTITPKMFRRMSQRTWRLTSLCVQHQGLTEHVTKAYVSDSNQIVVAYWSVYGDFSPTLYNGYRVFLGIKRPGRGADHPTPI
jgi:hypothetical protein